MSNARSSSGHPLRGEIENVLRGRGGTRIAGTAKWIASQVKASVRTVEAELTALHRAGILTTRQLTSGEVLWKTVDRNHNKWQAHAGVRAGSLTTR